jgi:hypothetical protein
MPSSLNTIFLLKSVIETLYRVKLVREQFSAEMKQISPDGLLTEMDVVAASTKKNNPL